LLASAMKPLLQPELANKQADPLGLTRSKVLEKLKD
jgi:hypothetical protein